MAPSYATDPSSSSICNFFITLGNGKPLCPIAGLLLFALVVEDCSSAPVSLLLVVSSCFPPGMLLICSHCCRLVVLLVSIIYIEFNLWLGLLRPAGCLLHVSHITITYVYVILLKRLALCSQSYGLCMVQHNIVHIVLCRTLVKTEGWPSQPMKSRYSNLYPRSLGTQVLRVYRHHM